MIWLPATAAIVVAAVAALWFFGSSYHFLDRYQFNGLTLLPPLSDSSDVVQTFRAPENGLSRVDLDLSIESYQGGEEVVFELYALGEGLSTAERPVLANKVREVRKKPDFTCCMLQRFSFEPIEDSGGRIYAIRLGRGSRDGGGPVQPRVSDIDAYADGGLFVEGKPTGKDLKFALFHEDGAGGIFARLKPFRPFPLDQGFFFTAMLLAAAGSFGWLLRVVARS